MLFISLKFQWADNGRSAFFSVRSTKLDRLWRILDLVELFTQQTLVVARVFHHRSR